MAMFEELMSKAIDSREASKLSPVFPELIKNLSPLEAKLIKALKKSEHITDDLILLKDNVIVKRLHSNFLFEDFGDQAHHLTLVQGLKNKNIVNNIVSAIDPLDEYPTENIPDGHVVYRSKITLSMFGKWFAKSCVRNEITDTDMDVANLARPDVR